MADEVDKVKKDFSKDLEAIDNIAENIANRGAEQRQNHNYDDSNQNENERVFDETLTVFAREVQHFGILLLECRLHLGLRSTFDCPMESP